MLRSAWPAAATSRSPRRSRSPASPSRRSGTPARPSTPAAWSTSPRRCPSCGSARRTATRPVRRARLGGLAPGSTRRRRGRRRLLGRPGRRLLDVAAMMDRLRSPGGCPWDAEQTPASLPPYLVEEAHELLHAIEDGDRARPARSSVTCCCRSSSTRGSRRRRRRRSSTLTPSPRSWSTQLVRRRPRLRRRRRLHAGRGRAGLGADQGAGEGHRRWGRLRGRPAARHPRVVARRPRGREGARPGAPHNLATPDAVARLERARAALAGAETDLRAALADLAGSVEHPDA